jgi:hypothetical protein
MKTEIVTMTPAWASDLLKKNTNNRNIRQRSIDRFAKLLKNGEWKLTHQGVAVSWEGILLDGQHRLLAIEKSGISADVLLSTECDPSIYAAIDGGISRTNADATGLPNRVVQVLNFFAYQINGSAKPTPGEIAAMNVVFGEATQSLLTFAPLNRVAFSSAPVRAAVVFLMLEGNKDTADSAVNLYRRLTLMEFDGLPPSTASFAKYCLTKPSNGGSSGQFNYFCRALKAFDNRVNSSSQCAYSEKIHDSAIARIKSFYSKKTA